LIAGNKSFQGKTRNNIGSKKAAKRFKKARDGGEKAVYDIKGLKKMGSGFEAEFDLRFTPYTLHVVFFSVPSS
jgi:hypothetical protein